MAGGEENLGEVSDVFWLRHHISGTKVLGVSRFIACSNYEAPFVLKSYLLGTLLLDSSSLFIS